ncbi:hypothetical protein BS78_06G006900 [Paspalum vaginatum]|nr:hypothetical protein BS78_06G006900 [Paspalum vaginatum]
MTKKRGNSIVLLNLVHLLWLPHVTSLSFDYNFSNLTTPDAINYMGDATAAGDRIDLTRDANWSTGWVSNGQPLQLWDNSTGMVASFSSNFTFAIKANSSPQGDGMAFFVRPYNWSLPQDSRGGFLGLVNNRNNSANTYFPPAVGVEFDTNRNVWDPNDTINHVGVDVNSITSVAYTALPDRCFINGTMSAWVRYDASSKNLSVTLGFNDLPQLGLYNVSATVDLVKDAGLPPDVAVGFSGATGDLTERHQILAWSFESTPTFTTGGSTTKHFVGLAAGLVSTGLVVLLLLVVSAWLLSHRKRRQGTKQTVGADMMDDDEIGKGAGPRRFTYAQLSQATQGFSDDVKLGEGGFGAVYRGILQEQDQQGLHVDVAVKRVSKTSRQGRREYIAEVTIISRLRHRNLVQLIGWCHEGDDLLLVYDLMSNGSLEDHLYRTPNLLTWPIRHNIILGMGSALLYLHQECEQCVVHRDIKPSNVMLDSSFNAKLGDFGLARLIDHSRPAHTTKLAGTKGYMDPQSVLSSQASAVSDIYSFGVVLLETVCGRKPVVPQEDESKVLLVHWVWDLYGKGQLLDAADERLRLLHADDGELNLLLEMERALVVGLWCVHPDHAPRPSIRQAMNVLQFVAPLPELPLEMPLATYGQPVGRHRRPPGYTRSLSASDGTMGSTSSACSAPHGATGSRAHESTPNHVTDHRSSTRSWDGERSAASVQLESKDPLLENTLLASVGTPS